MGRAFPRVNIGAAEPAATCSSLRVQRISVGSSTWLEQIAVTLLNRLSGRVVMQRQCCLFLTLAGAQLLCNGRNICSRKYSNVTFVGSHDAPFVGPLPQQNQNIDIPAQLELGIRFLQGQTHRRPITGTLSLCHTSCLLEDAGSLTGFLERVKRWLDGHPREVVTLLLTNGDSVNIDEFAASFTASGITRYTFIPEINENNQTTTSTTTPNNAADWPTLDELILTNQRLVVFLDYGANTTHTPYILDEFAYFFETAFDVTDAQSLGSACTVDRPRGASPVGRMALLNHFLDVEILPGVLVPDRERAAQTNAAHGAGSIGAQVAACRRALLGEEGRVNVVLLDFVDEGEAMAVQDAMNS
ncbi:hypothetical protein ASPZODRAFT_24739 [Penicilliopsis zonata CBS 506.65]|uniref:Phosphatidylinositol-specific phospholipase C X domain-containing protein n=1 Tax=Penicilliopsis zonata CBS 506.65 TaxID=1073090 RepID=A0A1L9SL55_9EURO|nr:hypothetical protein ASPZODRAFT_24739 [Penicilliopsis zonata CBS 506.65]OJJ47851.1 hypothetical protein ASPZODRAFT_24739 [Penicilliopsis zonata CBS 506.65]